MQRVGRQLHILQVGEKLEQRIARLRHQDFVPGIAQQSKNVGVAFAGAGGEDERFRIELRIRHAARDSSAATASRALAKPFGLRIVVHRFGSG